MDSALSLGGTNAQQTFLAASAAASDPAQDLWTFVSRQSAKPVRAQPSAPLLSVTSTASLTANTIIAALPPTELQSARSAAPNATHSQDALTRVLIRDVLQLQPAKPNRSAFLELSWRTASSIAQASLQAKPKGHIQWLDRVLRNWNLTRDQAQTLLGLNSTAEVVGVMDGSFDPIGRDVSDRIRYLLWIDEALSNLYRDQKKERAWLGRSNDALSGASPLSLMLDGSMRSLIMVKELLDFASGR